MNKKQRFVAFGQQNELKNTTETHINQIKNSVNEKYANQLKSAGFLQKLFLKYKMGKEVNKKIKEMISDHKYKLY